MLGLLTIERMDCDGVIFAIVKPWFELVLWVLGYAFNTHCSLPCTKVTVKGCSFPRNKKSQQI